MVPHKGLCFIHNFVFLKLVFLFDLSQELVANLFSIAQKHRGVRLVEDWIIDRGIANAERTLDHDHL